MSRFRLAWLLLASGCSTDLATIHQPIIGGQTVSSAEFPTVVALENAQDWSCTGTLVDKDWVLSAAHCVVGETTASLKIRFDDANLNDTTGGKVVGVSEIHAKPDWVDPVWDNDIALIRLAASITDRPPTPIERHVIAAGTSVTEVGYGDSDNNGGGSGVLRKVATTTIDCASTHDSSLSGANLLCFDPRSGHASCDGDSGGPAFVTVDGVRRTAGINSGNTGNTCTTGWELYTAIAGELDFINMYLPEAAPPDTDPPADGGTSSPPDDSTSPGGCRATSGHAAWPLAVLAIAVRRRRRQRPR